MDKRLTRILNKIKEQNIKIAFAESVTCGLIAHKLNTFTGTSEFLMGSIVCYNPEVKKDLFSVPEKLIQKFTTESSQVTEVLARNLSKLITADLYGAVTGLATALPGSPHQKGTIFLCLYNGKKLVSEKKLFRGTPKTIRKKAFGAMMELIARQLKTSKRL